MNKSINVYTDKHSSKLSVERFAKILNNEIEVIENSIPMVHTLNGRPTQCITFVNISDVMWSKVKRAAFTSKMKKAGNIQNFGK